MKDGASAEIAVVGNEGAVGVALFMGGETTPSRAIVQSAGFAYRLTGGRLKQEFNRHGQMLHILLRYTQSLITQMAQTAVCNRHHSVDQQLCRWLLLSLDRLSSDRLKMTQELIANMLGVRREGVTLAAGKLQEQGVIRYSRGQITVLDRPELERLCCECYAVVKKRPIGFLRFALNEKITRQPPSGRRLLSASWALLARCRLCCGGYGNRAAIVLPAAPLLGQTASGVRGSGREVGRQPRLALQHSSHVGFREHGEISAHPCPHLEPCKFGDEKGLDLRRRRAAPIAQGLDLALVRHRIVGMMETRAH